MNTMAAQSNEDRRHGNSTAQAPANGTQELEYSGPGVITIPSESRKLLEEYSNIAPDEVTRHVTGVRDKASALFPYGCVSRFRFLTPRLPQLPIYPVLLERLRSGDTFLDVGCCFGQEIRYLVQAGVSSSQMYGLDLEQRFIEMGYDLFQDRDRLHAKFVSGDLLAAPGTAGSDELDILFENMDIVFASSLLHFWDWEDMLLAAIRLVSFTKNKTGSMVGGRQMGSLKAGSYFMPGMGGRVYRHNVESMKAFWDQVGERTESKWRVEAGLYESEELKDERSQAWAEPSLRTIWFSAVRE